MSSSISRFRSSFFLFVVSLIALSATAATAQPFDELHCYRMRDTVLHEAAVSLIEQEGSIPETCALKSRGIRACVPARTTVKGEAPATQAADGSLLFDRICYKIACEPESNADTETVTDRFGEHDFALGDTTTLCMPAALGDIDDFMSRGTEAAAAEARKRAIGISQDVELFTCGDFNDDGNLTAVDALGILKTAVGSAECVPCVCDVDMSDSVTATDALASLQNAVGILADLNCLEDGSIVTWDGGGDGISWSDPLNWSLDTRTPNICEDVRIQSGAIVTVETDAGDHKALRVTSGFPFDVDRGTLTLRDTIQVNNTFRFTGGELADGTILPSSITRGEGLTANGTVAGGPIFTSSNGTLNNVTVNAPMDFTAGGARTNVVNGLTLNDTATMGSSAQIVFAGGTQTFDGTGTVHFNSASQAFVNASGVTNLTIGSGITIRGKAGRVGNTSANLTMTNNGTVSSDETGRIDLNAGGGWTNENQIIASNGGSLLLNNTWTNNSFISISGGGVLTLDGDWDNDGTISAGDSIVELDGEFNIADLGTFNRSGGTVKLTGIFDNILALTLDSTTGNWEMRGGTILGGTVTQVDGAEMIFTSSNGTLDGVTFNSSMNFTAGGARTNVVNNLTLNNTATMGSSAQIVFAGGTQTLDGTGTVHFNSASQAFVNASGVTNLTIGPDITIRGKAGRVGNTSANLTMTNNGVIDSDETGRIDLNAGGGWTNENQILAGNGGSLLLNNTWTNNSFISITGGGTLTLDGNWDNKGTITSTDSTVELDGEFTLSDLGTFNRSGGTVKLTGTLDNVSNLTLDSTTGNWEMRGGRINGGMVDQADGAEMIFTSSNGTLDGVTFDSSMNFTAGGARTNVVNNLTLNNTATMGSSAQIVFAGGTQTLGGTGTVHFNSASQAFVNTSGVTNLTIGPDITIHGKAGRVGNTSANLTMTNNGIIHSDETGRIDLSAGGGWTNENQILASNGGSLLLNNPWTNNSIISITGGGTLTLDGNWDNEGTISSTDSIVELDGNFTLSDLGTFNRSGGTVKLTGTFDNVLGLQLNSTTGVWEMRGGEIIGGTITGADGVEMLFTSSNGTLNGVTFDAPMDFSAGGARTNVVNSFTLNDTATMGSSAQFVFAGGTQTFDGTGTVHFNSASQAFVNASGVTNLTIGPDITIRGKAGRVGNTSANFSMTNNGTISSDETGRIDMNAGGGWTNGGSLEASGGGELRTLNSWTNNGSIVVGETGTFTADTGLPLTAAGDVSVDIGSATDFGVIDVTGAATLAGTLNINLTNAFVPTAGQMFTIMNFDSASGSFDTVNGTDINGSLEFSVNVGATDITLAVVAK